MSHDPPLVPLSSPRSCLVVPLRSGGVFPLRTDTVTDWELPGEWQDEHDTSAAIAAGLRVEAEAYRVAAVQRHADAAHIAMEADALDLARMSCIQSAAKIERELRGIT